MDYVTTTGAGTEMLTAVFIGLFYLSIWGIALICYILSSLAFYKIAKRRGIKNPWLSWIPVANSWIIGKIANEYDKKNGHDRPWHKALLILSIIAAVTMSVFYVMFIILIIGMSLSYDYYMGVGEAVMLIVSYIGIIIGVIAATAYQILSGICVYKTFESTVPEKALKYIILYFLVPAAGPICLVKCMEKGYECTTPALEESTFESAEETGIE